MSAARHKAEARCEELTGAMRPGLMLSQVWREARGAPGATAAALNAAGAFPFFKAFQIVDVPDAAERREIAEIVRRRDLSLTYSLSGLQYHEGVNPSALSEALRRDSIDSLSRHMVAAREAGAEFVQILGGMQPEDPSLRAEALVLFEKALGVLAERATELGLAIVVEPMDVAVHKKGTLGYTNEAVALVDRLSAPNLGLCVDTAHMYLNGEVVEDFLADVAPITGEFHFSNCVLENNHPLRGDHHIPFGPPGWLDEDAIARILLAGQQAGMWSPKKPTRTFCEIRRPEAMAPEELVLFCQQTLERAWDKACKAGKVPSA
jgi:sugar phosphate isomerase/epimerase